MTFAFWRNVSGTGAEAQTKASVPGRGLYTVEHHVVTLFVLGIPHGVTKDEVVEAALGSEMSIRNADGMGFEDQWPEDVGQQRGAAIEKAWSELQ